MSFEQWFKMAPYALGEIFKLVLPWAIGIILVLNLKLVLNCIIFLINGILFIFELILSAFSDIPELIRSCLNARRYKKFSKLSYDEKMAILRKVSENKGPQL